MITAIDDEEESIRKMGVGGNENRVKVVNATIDMSNNNDGDKNDKDAPKDNEDYYDGDDENDEDDDNDDGEDNGNENNKGPDSEKSDNGKGKNDAVLGSDIGLDEIIYAAIDTFRKSVKKQILNAVFLVWLCQRR